MGGQRIPGCDGVNLRVVQERLDSVAGLPVSRVGSYAAPSAEELRAFFTGPYGGERGGSRLDESAPGESAPDE